MGVFTGVQAIAEKAFCRRKKFYPVERKLRPAENVVSGPYGPVQHRKAIRLPRGGYCVGNSFNPWPINVPRIKRYANVPHEPNSSNG